MAIYLLVTFVAGVWHVATVKFDINWDDALLYAQSARQLSTGNGYTTRFILPSQLQDRPAQTPPFNYPVWTNKPLYTYILGSVFSLFGSSNTVALLTSYAIYVLGGAGLLSLVFFCRGPVVATATIIGFLFSPFLITLSTSGLTDVLFTGLLSLAIISVATLPARLQWITGVLIGGIVLTRPNGLLPAGIVGLTVLILILSAQIEIRKKLGAIISFALPASVGVALMLYSNYAVNGNPFWFYDTHGWLLFYDRTPAMPHPDINYAFTTYYYLSDTWLSKAPDITGVIFDKLARNIDTQWAITKAALRESPDRFLVLLLGLLWLPSWRTDRQFRIIGILLVLLFLLQFVFMFAALPGRRFQAWAIPVMCVMAAIAFSDIFQRIGKSGIRYKKTVRLLFSMVIMAAATNAGLAQLVEQGSADRKSLWGYQWDSRVRSIHRLATVIEQRTEPDALIIAVNRGEQWLAWNGNRYVTRMPLRFRDFLGILKKLNASSYYIAGHIPLSEYPSVADIRSPGTWLPEAEEALTLEYGELVNQDYYIVLFKLDREYFDKLYADEIEKLP